MGRRGHSIQRCARLLGVPESSFYAEHAIPAVASTISDLGYVKILCFSSRGLLILRARPLGPMQPAGFRERR